MMETGSNDVMVVKANLKDAFGMKERLIPFLHGQVIKKVDLTARVIEADWDLVLTPDQTVEASGITVRGLACVHRYCKPVS